MKILLSTILIITVSSILSFSVIAEDNTSTYSSKTGYELYKQRVQNICKDYDYNPKIADNLDDYKEIKQKNKYSFNDIKKTHTNNMNNIYKCGLITTQKKSYQLIKDELLKKGSELSQKISGKIDNQITKLDKISQSFKCTKTDDKNSIQKLILLKQATYQTCKYISYLEYLKEYNKNIKNNLDPKKGHYTPLELVQTEKQKLAQLDNEIQHVYKVFPLAFQAYTQYENNITAHILLKLLKEDYIAYREMLHKTLNPINQVVYKISNAMKK
ncbi:hypothetical protein LRZ95_01605 [Candidatus Gracilibacteria bacterium]|nr:hypothetical protein [Candidatus Gracilibacteria bacterium]